MTRTACDAAGCFSSVTAVATDEVVYKVLQNYKSIADFCEQQTSSEFYTRDFSGLVV